MGCVVVVAVVNVVTLSRCVLEVAIYVGAATLYSSCCMLFRSPCQQRQRPLASIVVFSCRWPLSARNPAARAPASRPTVACWSILLLFASRWRHDVVSERPQRGILAPRPTRPDRRQSATTCGHGLRIQMRVLEIGIIIVVISLIRTNAA